MLDESFIVWGCEDGNKIVFQPNNGKQRPCLLFKGVLITLSVVVPAQRHT